MSKNIGSFALLRQTNSDQWREGLTWLWYSTIGVALPIFFVGLSNVWRQESFDAIDLFRDGELFIYSASFWIYTLYNLDRTKIGAAFFRTIPYLAIAVISLGFSYIQAQVVAGNEEASITEELVYTSVICFVLSVIASLLSNLIYNSKSALLEKARINDTFSQRKKNQNELAKQFQDLGDK